MLTIENLQASVADKAIIKGLSLSINPGEVHAVMGPNGSGKSTLSSLLAGRDDYTIQSGKVMFKGQDLLTLSPEERALAGIFLAFQYPVEIPGVNNSYFLRTALNSLRRHNGLDELDAFDCLALIKEKAAMLDMNPDFFQRSLNEGFSGGEKKKNEILQMLLLEPSLAILDETDSGLDIDALQIISKGVNSLRSEKRSMLVITHYQRLLDYIEPDFVHILKDGKIIQSGDKNLAKELEEKGYGWVTDSAGTVNE